jgi:hypothetical protein
VEVRVTQHEAGADGAHVDTVEQRQHVIGRGVPSAAAQTVGDRPDARVAAAIAVGDAPSHLIALDSIHHVTLE